MNVGEKAKWRKGMGKKIKENGRNVEKAKVKKWRNEGKWKNMEFTENARIVKMQKGRNGEML